MIVQFLALLLLQEPPPPPPPPIHSRYGPLTQCLNSYAVTATAAEAVGVMGDGFSVFSDTAPLSLEIDPGDPYRARQRHDQIDTPNLGRLDRYQQSYDGRNVVTYLIPPRDGGHGTLVYSSGFDGSNRDLAILGRIARVEGPQACGDFRAPVYPGETPEALLWRSSSTPGPSFHCQNGIGFPVLAGEALQAARQDDSDGPSVRLSSPNPQLSYLDPVHLVVRGPMDTVNGTGAVAAAYRPRTETMSDGDNVILMPPRTDSERHGPDNRYRRRIRIAYPPGQEAAARAFANRIEFVARSDPRCHGDSRAP